jgi:lipoprotein-anchoring transpeptidase ErfK/SrfK
MDRMTTPTRALAIVATALAVSAVACAQPAPVDPDSEQAYAETQLSPTPPPQTDEEVRGESIVATAAVQEIEAFRRPEALKPFATFEHPGPFGTPRVFLVTEDADDWLRVLLPMRPNETQGWVRAEDVVLASNPYRLDVDLSEFRLRAYRHDRVVVESSAAIGTGGTPTPTGLFYTTILAKPDSATSPYGKYAYGLSAYSEVLTTFAGGEGQVAIHGTNQPSLIGSQVSHGCVRVDNKTISKLARLIPLGTPVRIHR